MKNCTKFIAALAALSFAAIVWSAETIRVSGIFTNLRYIEESGDLLGMELLVLPTGGDVEVKYSVLVQIAEGGTPYVALVPFIVKGNQVEFTLPAGGAYGNQHFVGTLSKSELTVHWSQGEIEKLKRGKSYWQ